MAVFRSVIYPFHLVNIWIFIRKYVWELFIQNEDERNGGLGFGGSSPVIQVAGKERYLTDEPRKLIESGNYHTEAHIMFGANEGEGIMAFDMMLGGYIDPNGFRNDPDFFKFDVVRVILGALSTTIYVSSLIKKRVQIYLCF